MSPIKEAAFERQFDAPISKVWQAWTDPKLLKKWWGPDKVDIDECEVDLKVGGRFYIVMVASEAMGPYQGTRWPMEAEFTEVDENKKLSYKARAWTEGNDEATQIDQVQTITFSEENGKTKVSIKVSILKTGPEAGNAIEGMTPGFTQQLGKLDTFLTSN